MSKLTISFGCKKIEDGIILSPGPLAGCGAPGADVMCWELVGEDGFKYYESAGLAGALNLAGAASLAIEGCADEPSVIYISDGKAEAEPFKHEANALFSYYLTDNTVVLAVLEDSLVDAFGNEYADEEIAAKLKTMNIKGFAVEADGALVPKDAQGFKKLLFEIYEKLEMAETPEFEAEEIEYFELGINPAAVQDAEGYKELIKALAEAFTGEEAAL